MKTLLLAGVGWMIACGFSAGVRADQVTTDPYLYMEEIEGTQALNWAKHQNDRTLPVLKGDAHYAGIESKVRAITLATDRIPTPAYQAGKIYNFWQDSTHVRGVWRRTSLAEYKKPAPAWETLLDLDALSQQEGENWVWKSTNCLAPHYLRCLITLSRGGQDASVEREFDVGTKSFVAGGFTVPEAKASVTWLDQDRVFVATDFGPGSLTDSGYPRIVKLWTRGTPLESAKTVFEGKSTDVSVWAWTSYRKTGTLTLFGQDTSFFTSDLFVMNPKDLTSHKLPFQNDAILNSLFQDQLLLQLRSDWSVNGGSFTAGSLVSIKLADFEAPRPTLVYAPNDHSSILEATPTRNALYLSILEDVKGKVLKVTRNSTGWKQQALSFPEAGSINLLASDPFGGVLLAQYESFLVPPTVFSVKSQAHRADVIRQLRKIPDRFDPSLFEVKQFSSISKDGTPIPYFVIQSKQLVANGTNPTVLYGYGGFEISETPFYLSSTGKVWLEGGGVYVLANIRGGGEFGPKWHQAAILQNKQKSYDDFISVAEDLIARHLTSPPHLGIMGGSNGGLLVGATFVERPDLFNAVVCQVPLLDMIRYPKLGAGSSWIGEYGNPEDPVMRDAILKYSPYQNVKTGVSYPEVFFETSTKDDRVHPAHARKMAARMEEQGHPFYYFENTQGGHGAAANLEERITRVSLEYTYLFKKLAGSATP